MVWLRIVCTTSLPPKMASSALKFTFNPNPNGVVSRRRCAHSAGTIRLPAFSNTGKINLPSSSSSSPSSTNYQTAHATRFRPVQVSGSSRVSGSDNPTFDVVIVGAGIIGLTIAHQFLLGSNLSVAVVDAAVPCAGATGAGIKLIAYFEVKKCVFYSLVLDWYSGWLSESLSSFCAWHLS